MSWSGAVSSLWEQFCDLAYQIIYKIINVLPDSPFIYITQTQSVLKILKYINWAIPFDFILSTFELWLSAIAVYYTYSIILRFFKAID